MNPHELDIAQAFIHAHPEAAARELESQELSAARELIQALSLPALRKLSPQLMSTFMARLCSELPTELVATMLTDAKLARCAMVMRCVPKNKRNEILDALPEKSAALTRLMLSYSEDSVGAHMNPHMVILGAKLHVEHALAMVKAEYGECDVNYLPVVDENQRPLASLRLRDLLNAPLGTPVARLFAEPLPTISSRMTLSMAAKSEAFAAADTAWVLNRHKQLVGLLKHCELRAAVSQTASAKQFEDGSDVIESFGAAYGSSLVALLDIFRPHRQREDQHYLIPTSMEDKP